MAILHAMGTGPDGRPRIRIWLDRVELGMIEGLSDRLRELLLDPNEAPRIVDRLFPPAFKDDPVAEDEHRRLVGSTLLEQRLESLREFDETLARSRDRLARGRFDLEGGEPHLWLHVINDMRLLLATQLDIKDNGWSEAGPQREEDAENFMLLLRLSDLQQHLLEVLSLS